MAVITDRRDMSPDPIRDPGTDRVRRTDSGLFFGGLVAVTALLVFGTLSVLAVLPMLAPGYTTASISSGSMMPTLRVGDVVVAADRGGATIAPETIVVYVDPRKGDLVTHRVIEVNSDGSYTTKGDMNGRPDPIPIPAENIRGEAVWIVPYVGQPRVWAAQGDWMMLGLTIAATSLAFWLARFGLDPQFDPWQPEITRVEPPA